jgi:hypothetical protein
MILGTKWIVLCFWNEKKLGGSIVFFILAVAHSVCDHGAFKFLSPNGEAMNHGFKGIFNEVLFGNEN